MNKKIIELEKYADEYDIPIMQKDGIEFLCNFIKENNIKKILEIGTAIGYSSIRMALVNDDIHITTIEKDKDRYLKAIENIKDLELDKRINVTLGDALDINIEGKYDLIFIDAAKGQYIKFFNKYSNNLSKNGYIISDNMSFHGLVELDERIKNKNLRQLVNKIRKYIDFLNENELYETVFYEVGDRVAISRKKEE